VNETAAVPKRFLTTEFQNMPVTGGTAPRRAWRTANKLAGFAISWVGSIPRNSERRRYLDVGCGSGFITELVAADFDEMVGIDMEETRLGDFRAHINGKSNFRILLMSAAQIEFPSVSFSS
jgi:2-polyprenyl-3-methyl-5-hydroxy-6-metoxy-1,4-benzoquinol methylase